MTPARRSARCRAACVLCAGALAMLPGCSLLFPPRPAPTAFFLLSSQSANPPAAVAPATDLALGLGPISLPAYLQRPEMVTRTGPNEVTFSETNRWAEPLKDNLVRVLSQSLIAQLGTERILPYPWYRTADLDYAIAVEVTRFEGGPGPEAHLAARWGITRGAGGPVVVARESHLHRPAGSPPETVAALSTLVGDLGAEIAAALRAQPALHPER